MIVEAASTARAPAGLTIDVRVERREFTLAAAFSSRSRALGLFGPSGAGKSTLLLAIAGLDSEATGAVEFAGETWLGSGFRRPPESRDVGYVPQDGLLFPHFDVRRNLLAGAPRARRRGLDVVSLFDTVCELLEIDTLLHRRADVLSGGERQRVALGRALISGPRLLLLDEPLTGLDLALRRRLLPLLARVRRELDVPMVLVSHEPTEIQALCEETVVLDRGLVVAHGPTAEVMTDPAVFPLAAARGYESVFEARVVEAPEAGGAGIVALGQDGVRLWTPRPATAAGGRLWVGIPADDVILARQATGLLSARNRLAAEVVSLDQVDGGWLVRAAIAGDVPPIAALLTDSARRELAVAPGLAVTLVIKANACRLYERKARG